jgi:hypothetical protein
MKFTPSPTKRIRFSDGKVLPLNRKERRANKIYNRSLIHGNIQPTVKHT